MAAIERCVASFRDNGKAEADGARYTGTRLTQINTTRVSDAQIEAFRDYAQGLAVRAGIVRAQPTGSLSAHRRVVLGIEGLALASAQASFDTVASSAVAWGRNDQPRTGIYTIQLTGIEPLGWLVKPNGNTLLAALQHAIDQTNLYFTHQSAHR